MYVPLVPSGCWNQVQFFFCSVFFIGLTAFANLAHSANTVSILEVDMPGKRLDLTDPHCQTREGGRITVNAWTGDHSNSIGVMNYLKLSLLISKDWIQNAKDEDKLTGNMEAPTKQSVQFRDDRGEDYSLVKGSRCSWTATLKRENLDISLRCENLGRDGKSLGLGLVIFDDHPIHCAIKKISHADWDALKH